MARRFQSKRELGAMSEINVTPLLDLAFALLIIFIITTPLLEQPVEVQLPSLVQSEEIVREAPQDPVQISINSEGTYFFGNEAVDTEALSQILSGYTNDRIFIVRGDREVRYGSVAEVLDILRNLGLTRVVVSYAEG
ncbi:biopolymer transporter ExbD [Puniceicoccus vermicola]|uniref:Biopolymer transporter ExbD n=1 Tax=Puniceicoccus vermicola TaxID=388746 RepID=A0A7X1E7X3_9BACT|nr:biopolymer transporter ExbD [Puniceicoccus vermicola]